MPSFFISCQSWQSTTRLLALFLILVFIIGLKYETIIIIIIIIKTLFQEGNTINTKLMGKVPFQSSTIM